MSIFKSIKEELKGYVDMTNEIVDDYKDKKVKEKIREAERVTTESLKSEQARKAYRSEVLTQANQNVIYIKACLKTKDGMLNRLGKRGNKELRVQLAKEVEWLNKKLIEETFYRDNI